ncbi:MAG: class I SAM-dependent methyltransferase [Thermomonas sp.]
MSLEQWETYYRGGMLATYPTAADGGFDREVRDAWVEFFSTLPAGARILDVGTGNGIVAMIAAETALAHGLDWEIDAADLARIDPMKHVPDAASRLAGITFHPGVATEHLPFAAESFDAVSGHYSLEYSDTAAALAEIHRVLKPGGSAQFILHHADSTLLLSARDTLRESGIALVDTQVFRRLHRLVSMDRIVPGETEEATEQLRVAIRTLKHAMEESRLSGTGHVLDVILDAVQKLLIARKEMSPTAVGLEVDRAEAEMRDSMSRLTDLIEHAKSKQGIEVIARDATAAGFQFVEHLPLFHAGTNLVGWQLLMQRP